MSRYECLSFTDVARVGPQTRSTTHPNFKSLTPNPEALKPIDLQHPEFEVKAVQGPTCEASWKNLGIFGDLRLSSAQGV